MSHEQKTCVLQQCVLQHVFLSFIITIIIIMIIIIFFFGGGVWGKVETFRTVSRTVVLDRLQAFTFFVGR